MSEKINTPYLRTLIGTRIRFKAENKFHNPDGWLYGTVNEVCRGQAYIGDDWYTINKIQKIEKL